MSRVGVIATLVVGFATIRAASGQEFRLIRALSGPSGKVQGSSFVFDEVRSRFVYPQDKSFIVYFEWDGPPGDHILSAHWKRPNGQIDSISPDVKIEAKNPGLTSYWTYTLHSEMAPGVWGVEVRIDGKPAGSHPFEIAGTTQPAAAPAPTAKRPTLDQLFRMASPSLVVVKKINSAGKPVDTASGFVAGKNRIATAFQSVDGAAKLLLEFADGRKVETDEILACSRMGDWAVIAADTADIAGLPIAAPKPTAVGERLITFNVESDSRVIGGVDVSGRRTIDGVGERIQFSPGLAIAAAGAPMLNLEGSVVAILGGNATPGSRVGSHQMSVSPALGIGVQSIGAATSVAAILEAKADRPSKLSDLASSGVLTAALGEMDGLLYVTTSREMTKSAGDPLPRDVGEFSKRDKQVCVISEWQKKGKVSKGVLSAKVYDAPNRVRITVEAKKLSLSSSPTRTGFTFPVAQLEPGIYRIDLTWDDQAVWRTFIRVLD